MKKNITLYLISGIIATGTPYFALAQNNSNETLSQQEVTQSDQKDEPQALMSLKEKRSADRKLQIAEERAQETSRFKKKAIQNTEAREKKYEEIMERKKQKASRFQKAAQEKADQEKEDALKKENAPSPSRFTEKAKLRAEERAKKQEEKEKRLRRNK